MGKPHEGPAAGQATWKEYLNNKKTEEKKSKEQPITIQLETWQQRLCAKLLKHREVANHIRIPSLLRLLALLRGCEWAGRAGRDAN